jgi:hypothetical protein
MPGIQIRTNHMEKNNTYLTTNIVLHQSHRITHTIDPKKKTLANPYLGWPTTPSTLGTPSYNTHSQSGASNKPIIPTPYNPAISTSQHTNNSQLDQSTTTTTTTRQTESKNRIVPS